MINLILILYVAPMLITFLIIYFDDDIKTVGDLLKCIRICLTPFVNFTPIATFIIMFIYESCEIKRLVKNICKIKIKK